MILKFYCTGMLVCILLSTSIMCIVSLQYWNLTSASIQTSSTTSAENCGWFTTHLLNEKYLKSSFRYFSSKKRVSHCWTRVYSTFPWVLKWKWRLKVLNICFENIFEVLSWNMKFYKEYLFSGSPDFKINAEKFSK